MPNKFCEFCGKILIENSKFCSNCGKAVPVAPPSPDSPDSLPSSQSPEASSSFSTSSSQASASSTPPPQTEYTTANAYSVPPLRQQPYYPNMRQNTYQEAPLSVLQYLGMIILAAIPIIGIILLFIWAFGSEENLNKKNYARAMLILMLIGIVLGIILSAAITGLVTSMLGSLGSYTSY